jgi:hypothetical protein
MGTKTEPLASASDQQTTSTIDLYQAIAAERDARVAAFPNLTSKLAYVMGDVDRIAKRGKNTQQNYDFVRESDIVDQVRRALSPLNVSLRFSQAEPAEYIDLMKGNEVKGQEVRVRLKMTITNGDPPHEVIEEIFDGNARDYGDKGLPKAITSARKIAHIATFEITTGDDPENNGAGDDHSLGRARYSSPSPLPAHRQDSRLQAAPANDRKAAAEKILQAAKLAGLDQDGIRSVAESMFPGSPSTSLNAEQLSAIAAQIDADREEFEELTFGKEGKLGTPVHRATVSGETAVPEATKIKELVEALP